MPRFERIYRGKAFRTLLRITSEVAGCSFKNSDGFTSHATPRKFRLDISYCASLETSS